MQITKDLSKTEYKLGDTIVVILKNNSSAECGFTVEAGIELADGSKVGYNAFYTAYFNKDTSWFIRNKQNEKKGRKGKVKFIPTDPILQTFDLNPFSEYKYVYVVSGHKSSTPTCVTLKFFADFKEDEPEIVVKSKPFKLFINGM